MTNYPYGFDNNITLPGVSGSSQEDTAITALRSAVFAIEMELGITPSGIYPDVRTRLDILESRLNLGVSPIIPNDGYVKSPLFIWNVPQNVILTISDGYGVPTENRLSGSLFMRGDGYANNQLYVRLNNTWSPVQTEQFVAANDLTGFPPGSDGHLAQTVVGIYNHPFATTMNTLSVTQDGYHITWNNSTGHWEAQTGFIPTHDLAAFSGPYGRTGQTVTGIQGTHVSPVAPGDGYMLVYSTADSAWEPRVRPMVFTNSIVAGDGYIARTNISSNKGNTQSPNISAAGKVGMINFGSRSIGATTGVTENYGAILSGDRLQVSGAYGVAVGGDSNTVSGQYGVVLEGLNNLASGQYSAVLNGTNNIANQTQSVVLDGYSNTASGPNSFVLNGGSNTAAALFSGILNGISNSIALGATHSGVGWGQFNAISSGGISSVILGGSGNQAGATNILIGTPINAHVSSNNASVLNGIGHTINANSDHSIILSGNTHTIAAASGFAFIGAGNNLTATGLYATILNSTGGSVNGLHTLVLNGNTNAITASFSTVVNGNNNTISGGVNTVYATIVDGYQHSISGAGSFIGDGYNNTISGQYSSILNGNFNTVNARNSTILNGGTNLIDVTSSDTTILGGAFNTITGTTNVVLSGSSNIVTSSNNTYVFGSLNNIQSSSSKIIGSSNTIGAGGTLNRILGNLNILGANSVMNNVFGQSNSLGTVVSTHDNTIIGTSNNVDGYGNSTILGQNNIAQASFTLVEGQFGKSRLYGQHVHANSRFTPGKIGEAQFSRIILDGYSNSGSQIFLQLQDPALGAPTNPSFVDGYSYDMQIRVMIVNTSPITPNPVVPARYVLDVLAHQEAGVLVLDNVNYSLSTPNTVDSSTRTPWTVTLSASANQLLISVDSEVASSFVQPSNTSSNRRAVATIEMREMSRL